MNYTELPKEGFSECIICGKKTKGTAFCKECWRNYTEEDLLDMLNDHEDENEEYECCIVCGQPSNGYPQCKECYYETKEYISSFDRNNTVHDNREYYYNLKDYIYRQYGNIDNIMSNCNKLIAIAINNDNNNDDSALINRAYNDVIRIIENKTEYFKKLEEKETENKKEKSNTTINIFPEEKTEQKTFLCHAEDGHGMDSDMEIIIDDILYTSEIFHCCHKPVTDITEKNKTSDWFIPIDSINKGIYIEYWGMETKKYLEDRKEKEELYKKYDIPYIGIEKDEPKKDRQSFKANLIREITATAEKYFGKMPKWKK